MKDKQMLKELWKNQEVPGYVGLMHESGEFYEFDAQDRSIKVELIEDQETEPEPVAIFDRCAVFNQPLEVLCGEGLSFGSNGFVLLLNTQTDAPIWSFLSGYSNPFCQVIDTGLYIVVISTSGSVFRFRVPSFENPLRDVFLSVP